MTTPRQTLKAIDKSIAHWERMLENGASEKDWPGAECCALCDLFLDNSCDGCPVAVKVGAAGCGRTPYAEARHALVSASFRGCKHDKPPVRKQVNFLKSVRRWWIKKHKLEAK